MEDNPDINYLLRGHIADSLSDQEKLQLISFLEKPENLHIGNELISKLYDETTSEGSAYNEEEVEKMIRFILNYSEEKKPGATVRTLSSVNTVWMRYAAAILILIGLGTYLFENSSNNKIKKIAQSAPVHKDLLPGSHKAVLTLSDGKKIELNSKTEEIITDGKLSINNKNGNLIYGNSGVVVYNTMTTPKGGQYKLTLPDNTKVWLNAASSITFPTAFSGDTRVVSITGEVYFEVAKNPHKPFTVKTYKDEIMVFGTSFNVNSYQDEPDVKTSLLEGSVHVNNNVLKPGQAYTSGKISTTDLDQDLSWKNEVFNFHHVKLGDAMRQIARWYDVEVSYKGKFNDVELGGEIGMNLTLQQVLSGLQDKELHFELNDKKLTVTQL